MSGHSKWHNIQGKKGKADKLRSGQFTKMARMITVAAKEGGGDPEMNFSLRLAVDKAKAVNMPKDNIDRAIKRGIGELEDGQVFESIIYEGFAPGGVALLIESLTDNRNRTSGELRNILSKGGGSFAGAGSVQWQFAHMAVVRVEAAELSKIVNKKADFELAMIDAGAEAIEESENGVEIVGPIENFQKLIQAVQSFDLEIATSALEWIAKEKMSVMPEVQEQIENLLSTLDDNDDVKEVYTNLS